MIVRVLKKESFLNKHPNGIEAGFIQRGETNKLPTVGEKFILDNLKTSTVIELLPQGCFRTANSIYQLILE